ncbi:MAG: eL32 family ribosomal protein [Candidatus Diapherotrites archaeon]
MESEYRMVKENKSSDKKDILKIKKKIKKKKKPVFRGHFGNRAIRRKSKAKWNKWRYPRGVDFGFEKADGKKPRSGYRTPKIIRGLHPSGLKESLVHNVKEVEQIKDKNTIIRIAHSVGAKKRGEIIKKAMEAGLKVIGSDVYEGE